MAMLFTANFSALPLTAIFSAKGLKTLKKFSQSVTLASKRPPHWLWGTVGKGSKSHHSTTLNHSTVITDCEKLVSVISFLH